MPFNIVDVGCLASPVSWSRKWKCQTPKESKQTISTIYYVNGSAPPNPCNHICHGSLPDHLPGKRPVLPTRMMFTLLAFLGFFSAFTMRSNLTVAMVAMVRPPKSSDDALAGETPEVCIELINGQEIGNNTVAMGGEFDWNPEIQQLALASFYFGYVALQIPAGIAAESYHAKHFFGVGILITAILTLLTPIAARHSIGALITARIIQGLAQAATFPAINSLICRWVPIMERSRISAIIYTGCTVGVVVSFAVSGLLCDSTFLGGWPSVFYVFGTLGCVWFILWTYFIYETPDDHPHISKAELLYIRKGQDEIKSVKAPVPWKSILTSFPVWGLVITHFGQDWGYHTFLIETPIYLNNVLHFDLKNNGFLSALPFIMRAVMAFLTSIIADKLRKNGRFHITTIRKIFNSIGFYGPGLCILLVAFSGCSPLTIIILMSFSMFLNGFVYSGFNCTHIDMSPEYCGTLMAITNSFSNVTGFIVPVFVGWILEKGNTLANWGIIFIVAFSILTICGTVYNIFCTADIQVWRPPKDMQGDETSTYSYQTNMTNEERENFRRRRLSFPL